MRLLLARIINSLSFRGFLKWIPDKFYLKMIFKLKQGYSLNLENPKSFNEKLQWLKLHDRDPLYTKMVDKYEVRKIIESQIGKSYLVPLFGVWKSFDEIDFSKLPNQFVLKCTHDSGGLVICKDKNHLNLVETRRKIESCLKRNYYDTSREWPYKNVEPRIIAEMFLDDKGDCLTDYKFFCFDGVPQIMYISKDKAKVPTTDFFDMNFNQLDLRMRDPNSKIKPEKPCKFEEMKSIAAMLSKNRSHLRVDFFCIDEKIYVGELTFYHMSGLSPIYPREWDYKLGEMIKIEKSN